MISTKDDQKKVPRGFLKVAHAATWATGNPPPRRCNLMLTCATNLGSTLVQTEAIAPGQADIADFKFLYMHGRASLASRTKSRPTSARTSRRAVLLADACCGKKPSTPASRLCGPALPDKKLEPIPLSDGVTARN